MGYCWFLGFGFYTEVPHFSTSGKNYECRYHETGVFEDIFYHILNEIMDRGLLSADHVCKSECDANFCFHEFKEIGYMDMAS
jgi:hypothetical protein